MSVCGTTFKRAATGTVVGESFTHREEHHYFVAHDGTSARLYPLPYTPLLSKSTPINSSPTTTYTVSGAATITSTSYGHTAAETVPYIRVATEVAVTVYISVCSLTKSTGCPATLHAI